MTDTINVALRLCAFVHLEGKYWESFCPTLNIYSQGDSEEEAKANLREAVELWIQSCIERNTLPAALQELGWIRIPAGLPLPPDVDTIRVSEPGAAAKDLGNPFPVEVTIPAYQAALFSSETSAATC